MKIALVHTCFRVMGGAENLISWLARELARRDHKVSVFAGDFCDETREHLVKSGIDVHKISMNYWDPAILPLFLSRYKVNFKGGFNITPVDDRFIIQSHSPRVMKHIGGRLAEKLRGYDIVNAFNFPSYHWVYHAKKAGSEFPPVIWSCFEPPGRYYEGVTQADYYALMEKEPPVIPDTPAVRADKEAVSSFSLVLALSNFMAGKCEELYGRKIEIGGAGVPPVRPVSVKTRPYKKIIASLGRLYPQKNFGGLIRAFGRLLREHPELKKETALVIVGEGPERKNLESLIKELSLGKNVSLPGPLSREALLGFMAESYMVAFLPLDEPLGLVPVEAGMLGKCVLASSRGGPADTVIHEKTGCCVDPLSEKDISDALWRLLNNPDLVDELGKSAREFCLDNFTISAYGEKMEKIYQKAAGKNRAEAAL
ncbi:MAG: glycosyltransferase family 4 protein [Chloroflexi bacterium]|nr:glycosyltransferase family 4 protein [Chloroflexota bacterium]